MSDPTDRGVSTRAPSPSESRQKWLAMLTKLVEAFPPQQGTDAALESRLRTYLEILAPEWHPETGAKAIKEGLRLWKFFPSIAEIETQCKRFAPGTMLVDSGMYPLLNGPEKPKLGGPTKADFASLLEALRTGRTREMMDNLTKPTA